MLQSYCFDQGTHGDQLAYDFLMTEGTSVAAVRAGVVVALVDQWEDSDWDSNHFNYLFIRHEDGSAPFYAHPQRRSFLVRIGEQVSAGLRIGSSGHCGTPIADLHFGVRNLSFTPQSRCLSAAPRRLPAPCILTPAVSAC